MAESSRPVILFVEDDPIQLEYYCAVLEDDWEVHTARGLADAKACLQRLAPDVVATDVHLADGSGLELLRWIRDEMPDLQAHTVLLSGAQQEDIRCWDVPVLYKPVPPDQLLKAITMAQCGWQPKKA